VFYTSPLPKMPRKARSRLREMFGSTVLYAPTLAGLSALLHDAIPWLARIELDEGPDPGSLRVSLTLPWWAHLTGGYLHRRVTARVAKLLHQHLPIGLRVAYRVQ
jgi:hypothetical protein